jgi:hypothetical protein
MRRGTTVDEVFGLPPVLMRVKWECERVDARAGVLDVRSKAGLAGVASDCRMLFAVAPTADGSGCDVELLMSYEPLSPLARLAVPVLMADNMLALNCLLPAALAPPRSKLAQFRELIGALFGFAGVAHLVDCVVGPSLMLTSAGAPPFADLPTAGQALALGWCLAGPVAFALSRLGGRAADAGLGLYGFVEVGCAAVAAGALPGVATYDAGWWAGAGSDGLVKAIGVQVVIAASWMYTARAGDSDSLAEADGPERGQR